MYLEIAKTQVFTFLCSKEEICLIKYADIIGDSVVDGTGIRVAVFLQGCPLACKGCHNPELQSYEGGKDIQEKDLTRLIFKKITPVHTGVTFSGGEPLVQQEALYNVLTAIKDSYPDLDIWVYTGYNFEEVRHLPLMSFINVLVDGPFILDQKDLSLPFRGSANQRVIHVPNSLREGRVVEIEMSCV